MNTLFSQLAWVLLKQWIWSGRLIFKWRFFSKERSCWCFSPVYTLAIVQRNQILTIIDPTHIPRTRTRLRWSPHQCLRGAIIYAIERAGHGGLERTGTGIMTWGNPQFRVESWLYPPPDDKVVLFKYISPHE